MHISGIFCDHKKQDIEPQKQYIETPKQYIGLSDLTRKELEKKKLSNKTIKNIEKLYMEFANGKVFGRTDIMKILGITASPASTLIKKMLENEVIIPVRGKGKGKYIFRNEI